MTVPRGTETEKADEARTQALAAPGSPERDSAEPPAPSAAEAGATSTVREETEPAAVPRAGAARATSTGEQTAPSSSDSGPNWAQGGDRGSDEHRTTVLPGGRPTAARPGAAARPMARGDQRPAAARPLTGRTRRARLSLRRIDPWSVFLFSLIASVFLGLALIVAVAALYAVLGSLGVTESINQLFAEVTGGSPTTGALLTSGRIIGGAAVLAAVNVVFLTLLATLGALLYNLCASFTGGLELTLGERD